MEFSNSFFPLPQGQEIAPKLDDVPIIFLHELNMQKRVNKVEKIASGFICQRELQIK